MYLLLNTSQDDRVSICFSDETRWQQRDFLFTDSMNVLRAIESVLEQTKQPLSAVRGVAVVVGKGRFTATRVAVVIGNTLAFALQIPIAAVTDAATNGLAEKIAAAPVGQLVLPTYSGGARVGGRIVNEVC